MVETISLRGNHPLFQRVPRIVGKYRPSPGETHRRAARPAIRRHARSEGESGTMVVAALAFQGVAGSARPRAGVKTVAVRSPEEAEWTPPSWDEVVREHSAR